jgi:hypothetical protein
MTDVSVIKTRQNHFNYSKSQGGVINQTFKTRPRLSKPTSAGVVYGKDDCFSRNPPFRQ